MGPCSAAMQFGRAVGLYSGTEQWERASLIQRDLCPVQRHALRLVHGHCPRQVQRQLRARPACSAAARSGSRAVRQQNGQAAGRARRSALSKRSEPRQGCLVRTIPARLRMDRPEAPLGEAPKPARETPKPARGNTQARSTWARRRIALILRVLRTAPPTILPWRALSPLCS